MIMFLIECYFTSLDELQRKKHSPCQVLVRGHLESNQLSLLTVIVVSVQSSKLRHNVLALLYAAHPTVLFAENTQGKI